MKTLNEQKYEPLIQYHLNPSNSSGNFLGTNEWLPRHRISALRVVCAVRAERLKIVRGAYADLTKAILSSVPHASPSPSDSSVNNSVTHSMAAIADVWA